MLNTRFFQTDILNHRRLFYRHSRFCNLRESGHTVVATGYACNSYLLLKIVVKFSSINLKYLHQLCCIYMHGLLI